MKFLKVYVDEASGYHYDCYVGEEGDPFRRKVVVSRCDGAYVNIGPHVTFEEIFEKGVYLWRKQYKEPSDYTYISSIDCFRYGYEEVFKNDDLDSMIRAIDSVKANGGYLYTRKKLEAVKELIRNSEFCMSGSYIALNVETSETTRRFIGFRDGRFISLFPSLTPLQFSTKLECFKSFRKDVADANRFWREKLCDVAF